MSFELQLIARRQLQEAGTGGQTLSPSLIDAAIINALRDTVPLTSGQVEVVLAGLYVDTRVEVVLRLSSAQEAIDALNAVEQPAFASNMQRMLNVPVVVVVQAKIAISGTYTHMLVPPPAVPSAAPPDQLLPLPHLPPMREESSAISEDSEATVDASMTVWIVFSCILAFCLVLSVAAFVVLYRRFRRSQDKVNSLAHLALHTISMSPGRSPIASPRSSRCVSELPSPRPARAEEIQEALTRANLSARLMSRAASSLSPRSDRTPSGGASSSTTAPIDTPPAPAFEGDGLQDGFEGGPRAQMTDIDAQFARWWQPTPNGSGRPSHSSSV